MNTLLNPQLLTEKNLELLGERKKTQHCYTALIVIFIFSLKGDVQYLIFYYILNLAINLHISRES